MPDPRTLVIALLAECHRLDDGTGIPGGWPLWADLSERMRRVYVEAMGNVLAEDGAMTDAAERCPRCDRAKCPTLRPFCHRDYCEDADPPQDFAACPGCAAVGDCAAHAVDWRTRSIADRQRAERAEEERDRLRAIATEAVDRARHDDHCNLLMGWGTADECPCDCRVRDMRAALASIEAAKERL